MYSRQTLPSIFSAERRRLAVFGIIKGWLRLVWCRVDSACYGRSPCPPQHVACRTPTRGFPRHHSGLASRTLCMSNACTDWAFNLPPTTSCMRKQGFLMASKFKVGNFVQEFRAQLPRMMAIVSSAYRMQNTGLLPPSKLKLGVVVQVLCEQWCLRTFTMPSSEWCLQIAALLRPSTIYLWCFVQAPWEKRLPCPLRHGSCRTPASCCPGR